MDTPKTKYTSRTRKRAREQKRETGDVEDTQTPSPSKKPTKMNSLKIMKKNKFSDRKYFTVSQDWEILSYWRENVGEISTREISDNLSEKMEHSSESIRDRIKRYISKLKRIDESLIEEEAKEHPGYYAHFTTDKSKNKKVITHFTAQQPKIAGSSLTAEEKKAIKRELMRKKREKQSSLRGTPKKSKKVIVKTEEDIKEEKDIAEKYKVKLRKRSPKTKVDDPYKELNPLLRQIPVKRLKRERNPKSAKNPRPHRLLQGKVDIFMDQLNSKDDMDVECNAEILAEIIKSFAVTFSLEISEIVDIISNQKGELNMEEIRVQLMNKGK